MKWRFVGRFLVAFAVLIPLATTTDFPTHYASALESVGRVTSPALNGWSFERSADAGPSGLRFRRGSESMRFELSLAAFALGLFPFLSLVGATPGMPLRRTAWAIVAGVSGLFALDLCVVLAYPWMVRNPNDIKDITGTFLGLLTFVGAPVILWFALTYRYLAPVWRLELPEDG